MPVAHRPGAGGERPQSGVRRWAVVALGDVVGYSTLMAADEARTHSRWMELLEDVIRPAALRHGGRVVDFRGDSIAAEFFDARRAVAWACDVQRAMREAHDREISVRLEAPTPITLRIGLHAGEIIAMDDDIAGDVVNTAARLQEYAQPGGIILSDAVYERTKGELCADARDLGLLELRNIPRTIRGYVIDAFAVRATLPLPRPAPHALPSIAVLPLQSLGDDEDDGYFADGVVEDIVVSLSGLHELFVIARTSTLMFRGAQPDPRHAGRALGVRYVLTGSLRRSQRAMRISLLLVDVVNGGTIWVDRIDFRADDLFAVQDDIVRKVVAGIAPSVHAAELRKTLRRQPESFSAYDHCLRALHVMNSLDRATFLTARRHLEVALKEDPAFAMPAAWLARWHSLYVGQGWSPDPQADAARAGELAQSAIRLDPRNALALATCGHQKAFLLHEHEAGLTYHEQAVTACPNSSIAWTLSSATLGYLGRSEEALRHAEQGLRLSPLDQGRYFHYAYLAMAHYANGDYEDAVKWASMAMGENPAHTGTYRILIVSLAGLNRVQAARLAGERLLQLEPDFRLGVYERTRQPFVHPPLRIRCMEHLRMAGLPE